MGKPARSIDAGEMAVDVIPRDEVAHRCRVQFPGGLGVPDTKRTRHVGDRLRTRAEGTEQLQLKAGHNSQRNWGSESPS